MLSKIKLHIDGVRCELDVEIRDKKPCSARRGEQLFDGGLTIDLAPAPDVVQELSICANIWRGGRDSEGGQCRASVREMAPYLDKDKGDALIELCKLWERWHLNAMIGASRAQREALNDAAKKDRNVWNYDNAVAHLTSVGLHPDQGYNYGQSWLVEPLPDDVVKQVGRLCVALGGRVLEL